MRGLTPESFAAAAPEIVCLITADDETFAQTVHARTSYDAGDVVWGGRFADMYIADSDRVAIDMARLHDYTRVDPPASL
jgi:inward rectifier potassium channel